MAGHSKNIPKDRLKEFYLNRHLSSDAIAKIFQCDHVTILNYLKKYGIPRRSKLGTRKPVIISKQILHSLYHKKHFTQKQIAEKLGYSRYGIQRWMKIYGIQSRSDSESHTKFPKFDFSGDPIEKAYMIGFRLGDLNVYAIHELIQVRCSTTVKNQADLMLDLFKRYCHVHIWKAKRGTYEIVALLNDSFDFLLPKKDIIEPWMLRKKECFWAFAAGYSDAEGSYYLRKPNALVGRVGWGIFEIQTYDKNILLSIFNKLKKFDIKVSFNMSRRAGYTDKRGVRTNKDCWRITIHQKQSLWNFIKLIESYHRHRNKLQDLLKVKNNLLLRNTLPYCKPITF